MPPIELVTLQICLISYKIFTYSTPITRPNIDFNRARLGIDKK